MKLQKFREYINKKVELNLVNLSLDGQLKDQGQKAQKIYLDGRRDAKTEMVNASRHMIQAQKNLEKLLRQIDDAYSRAKRNAKDMGVDIDKTKAGTNFKRTYNEVQDYVIDAREKVSFIRKLANKI